MKSKEPEQNFFQTILENGIFNVKFELVQMKFYFYFSSSSSNIITGGEDLIESFFKHRLGIIIFSSCKHLNKHNNSKYSKLYCWNDSILII